MTTTQERRVDTVEDADVTASVNIWWDGEGVCGCCVDCPDLAPGMVVDGWECHACGATHIVIGSSE
jgi:hypothetical protein